MAQQPAETVSKGELRLCARLGLDEAGTQSLLAAMRGVLFFLYVCVAAL